MLPDIQDKYHTHQTQIILAGAVLLICVWVHLYFSPEREGLIALPRKFANDDAQAPDDEPLHLKHVVDQQGPKRIYGDISALQAKKKSSRDAGDRVHTIKPLVFFLSLTGQTEKAASDFVHSLRLSLAQLSTPSCRFLETELLDLTCVDFDDYFISPPQTADVEYFYILLIPSFDIDTLNDAFLEHLKETHNDFRIDTAPLSSLVGYAVFGFGDRADWPTEQDGYCSQAIEADKYMAKLTGRKRAYPLGMGDMKVDGLASLQAWLVGLVEELESISRIGGLGEGVRGSGDAEESDGQYASDEEDAEILIESEPRVRAQNSSRIAPNIGDLEDLDKVMAVDAQPEQNEKAPLPIDFTTYSLSGAAKKTPAILQQPKEMVPKSSPTYAALTKQGYAIVGSHSGVKICRWTKSALRGRGSCYKYSFYGINSHQCMESTPSLSCSNKCVFCWRHGTNPVGTVWRWQVDAPQLIFDGIKQAHYKKIKMLRGVPGVRAERFQEAMHIRHCALSLVGEPIFYPHINEFVGLLHAERISTFLVCNAQHPEQLAALVPVTQLYVSIDAADRDSLRRIDRPLHRDFWERFQRCLDILRENRFRQRTVFRLTLVKGFNVDDDDSRLQIRRYADLVDRALPCFVEIKGVTYCGTSTSSAAGLTMSNVPFYAEVQAFVEALNDELAKRNLGYGIAAEHAHSCCALIASERFRGKGEGVWHTRIDYERFFQLWEERGPQGHWMPEDYVEREPTPEWAMWGNGGFDPRDVRVDRKGRKIEL